MRILHVIPSIASAHGGPSMAVRDMAAIVQSMGHHVEIVTTDDDGFGRRRSVSSFGEPQQVDGVTVRYFPRQTNFYKVSLPLSRWLKKHMGEFDLVHIHALFSFASLAAVRAARAARVPYILRPLGVLNRWGMENRRPWLKRLSFRCLEAPALRNAAAVHFTAEAERSEAEQTHVRMSAAIVPLGISCKPFEDLPTSASFGASHPRAVDRPLILFLSRLDAKKGIELLLAAFAQVRNRHREAALVIAGNGNASYVDALKEQTARLGIADDVIWTGFIAGDEKLAALSAATVFVLPSHSENFGIAAVEALAAGLPCLLTKGVAISDDVMAARAGVVVEPDVSELAKGIDQLLSDPVRRSSLGANARALAGRKFSIAAMGRALEELYQSVARRAAPIAAGQ